MGGGAAELDYTREGSAIVNLWGKCKPVKAKIYLWNGVADKLGTFTKAVLLHKQLFDLNEMAINTILIFRNGSCSKGVFHLTINKIGPLYE